MSRFHKLSHAIWHCQYHIFWIPKYRLRIPTGQVADEVTKCIRDFSERKGCEVVELYVQIDHVHLIVLVLPKISISGFAGGLFAWKWFRLKMVHPLFTFM